MYQQALSKWYGEVAGHDFTEEWIAKLIMELQAVTQSKLQVHRTWLRRTMHTWWPHTVQNDNRRVWPARLPSLDTPTRRDHTSREC